jgi:hypothetical protein
VTTIEARPSAPGGFAHDDLEQLRLLSIFHYVVAGIVALVALVPGIHLAFGLLMVTGHLSPEDDGSRVIGWIMTGCASFAMTLGLGFAGLIALAGRSLAQRRRYTFCLVVAAILCLLVPFGTLLGVFTIVVLVRHSVKALFEEVPAPPDRL